MESQELITQEEQQPVENSEQQVATNPNEQKETLSLRDSLAQSLQLDGKKEIERKPVETPEKNNDESKQDQEKKEAAEEEFRLIPKEWNDKERSSFEALKDNPETKEAYDVLINRYENMRKDYHKKNKERSELAKKADIWDNILDKEAKESLKRKGVEAPDYFKSLVNIERGLISNPADTIKGLMNHFNIDPNSVLGTQNVSESENESDYLDYDQELAKVKEELKAIKDRDRQSKEQYQRTQEQATAKTIQDFKYATGEDGELKYPLFDQVRDEMGLLLNKGEANTLEEAYKKSPTVLLKQKEQELLQKAENDIEQERQRVAKAKKASAGLSPVRSTNNPALRGSDLRAILTEKLSQY